MMRIGELASVTGETVKTLRFWADNGLLEAKRSETRYRYFSPSSVDRARFIRHAQTLGFTLSEIRGFLQLRDNGVQPCDDVRSRLSSHLEVIRERLQDLKALEAELEARLRWAETDGDSICEDSCIYLAARTPSERKW